METTTTQFRAAFAYANGMGYNYAPWRETVDEAVADASRREAKFAELEIAGTTTIQKEITSIMTIEVPF